MAAGLRRGVAIGGFMGAGKSAVGPRVAERLGLPFVDLDAVVQAREGRAVSGLFAERGEAGFRVAEAAALRGVVDGGPCVLALGGGTLHEEGNRALLAPAFFLVVLRASWQTLQPRLASGEGRPLAGQAQALLREREAGYRRADAVVDVDGLTLDEVAEAVCAAVRAA